MSHCSNRSCCWCCRDWSLWKLLLFPEQSLTPLSVSFLARSTVTATVQGAGSACVQLLFIFCSSRSLACFLFPCWFWALATLSPAHTDSLGPQGGKEKCALSCTHRKRFLSFNASCHSKATSSILLSTWYAFISSLHILLLKEEEKTEVIQ